VKFKGNEPLLVAKAEVKLAKLNGFNDVKLLALDKLIPAKLNPEIEW
jgi:hypothetical protein